MSLRKGAELTARHRLDALTDAELSAALAESHRVQEALYGERLRRAIAADADEAAAAYTSVASPRTRRTPAAASSGAPVPAALREGLSLR